MGDKVDLRRRRLVQAAGLGAALAATPGFPVILKKEAFRRKGREVTAAFAPDVEIELVAKTGEVPILPGRPTRVWHYQGRVLKGDPGALIPLRNTYLGPVLKLRTGQKVRITLKNQLPQNHIIHWHGMHVPAGADGHPKDEISPGETYVYEFEVRNRASTNWFHPHTHMATAAQAYAGLAGLIIVEDDEEQKVPLPRGEFDIPLVIQDRTFTADNQLLYDHRGPLSVLGFLGERILVNGRPDFAMEVAGRSYRFRVLNGSNSRIYKLAWSDGEPVTVIGTDGGLLERPVTRPYLMVSPGERYEIWRDFSNAQGREVTLESLDFHGTMPPAYERHARGDVRTMMRELMGGAGAMGMMGRGGPMRGGMMGGMGGPMAILSRHIPQGQRFTVARFRVTRKASGNQELPDRLRALRGYRSDEAANPGKPRPIAIGNQGMRFTLNGHLFEMTGALPVETFPVNTLWLMEIFHAHGDMDMGGHGMETEPHESSQGGMAMDMGMMLGMAHPMHLHGQYFQIVRRQPPEMGGEHGGEGYETVKDGFVDEGFHDTVLVMAGERVRLLKPFADYKGLFVYHCHNLEHENAGMMRNFKVI
ncbi:MAG TPA: multicopper oxidase family protein [Methylothermaceae bacterium]|nr:multicopper oxidase family protein [Methylothermaceae bacterium]